MHGSTETSRVARIDVARLAPTTPPVPASGREPRPTTATATTTTNAVKLFRFAVVTLLASPGNLALYATLLANTTWPAIVANFTAAVVVAGPTYLLNRRWVWQRRDAHSIGADVAPYWAATVLNVGLSSLAAAVAERAGATDSVLVATTFAVYTVLWVARFVFLDALFQGRLMNGSNSVSA
ncbi:MAG: GtrA family protein [Actinomycetota bacterium]